MVVLVPPIFGKFSSSRKKCDVAPESITNFNLVCFAFSDLCLPPGLFKRVSICLVCVSVRLLINSSVASAVSSIKFALNCLAVALVCLFSFAYSLEMNVLMFTHVFVAAVLLSHSRTAGSYYPVFFK